VNAEGKKIPRCVRTSANQLLSPATPVRRTSGILFLCAESLRLVLGERGSERRVIFNDPAAGDAESKNVLLLYRRDANSPDFSDFRGCGQWQRRSDVALAFSSICDKIDVDLRKGLDAAGLFESYLR
jgi:hypothetical protein